MQSFRNIPTIMLIPRGILRKLRWRQLLLVLVISLITALVLSFSMKPNNRDLLALHKCPACYGVSLCSDVLVGPSEVLITFDVWGRLGLLANIFFTKNVFSGSLNHRKVIVKRLGHDSELETLDNIICRAMGDSGGCDMKMKEIVFKVQNLRDSVKNLLSDSTDFNNYRLRLCPSVEHVDRLFSPVLPKADHIYSAKLGNDGFTANIWTLLQVNPEPLLLQIMRAEDGWPVSHYLGSCGRIAVTLNEGEPLAYFHSRAWTERAGLALQLLLAADRFTYSHPHFAFYLLDVSADNIVVSEKGKLTFVDLEHVIIVDRHPSGVSNSWNESHVSESYDCPGCSMFSPSNICSHHTSDHNHFMICQQLLAPGEGSSDNFLPGGLLHSTPSEIRKHYPQIETFLLQCSSGESSDRIRSARRLRDILNIISKESPLFGDPSLMQSWKYF